MTTTLDTLTGRAAGILLAALITLAGHAWAQDTSDAQAAAAKERAARQVLESAYLRHHYVTKRVETAKSNMDLYRQALADQERAIAVYADKVAGVTDDVREKQEEVEGKISVIKEAKDKREEALREQDFDLQQELNEVGGLEYLPRKEADRQARIAAIRVKQRDVRNEIRLNNLRAEEEIAAASVELNAAVEQLRAAENDYKAHYQAYADAQTKVFQAKSDIEVYTPQIEKAAADLAKARASYAPYGDPATVENSVSMPSVTGGYQSNSATTDDTIAMMREMLVSIERQEEAERLAVEEASTGHSNWTVDLDGDGDADAPSMGDTVNIAGHEVNPLHIALPVTVGAIIILALL